MLPEKHGAELAKLFGPVLKRPQDRFALVDLEDCPEELAELRAPLPQEHVWRKREGLG